MKKRVIALTIASATLVSAVAAHDDHEHATGIVRERMIVMEKMGKALLAMSRKLRANKGLAAIPDDARTVQDLAGKVTALFPAGSTQSPTAAKPETWQNWADFEAKAKALETEATRLAAMTGGDGTALRAQFRAVGFACDSCHNAYRMTKGN